MKNISWKSILYTTYKTNNHKKYIGREPCKCNASMASPRIILAIGHLLLALCLWLSDLVLHALPTISGIKSPFSLGVSYVLKILYR